MKMVERVARAMSAEDGFSWDHCAQSYWMAHARVAMEAMREPTEDMDKAARDECHKMKGVIDPVVHIWDRMIDAALTDGERTTQGQEP